MTPVRLEPAAPRSRVKYSTTEPLRSLEKYLFFQHFSFYEQLKFHSKLQGGVQDSWKGKSYVKKGGVCSADFIFQVCANAVMQLVVHQM